MALLRQHYLHLLFVIIPKLTYNEKSTRQYLAVILGIYSGASAQSFHLGATLGADLTKINSTSFNTAFKAGFLAGAYAQIRFGEHWGLEPGALFIQTNTPNGFQLQPDLTAGS